MNTHYHDHCMCYYQACTYSRPHIHCPFQTESHENCGRHIPGAYHTRHFNLVTVFQSCILQTTREECILNWPVLIITKEEEKHIKGTNFPFVRNVTTCTQHQAVFPVKDGINGGKGRHHFWLENAPNKGGGHSTVHGR